ncbi:MAG TPA: hypothetical protein VN851_06400 [Thermoanaerobaculia bacterium]|nr:hypothetical protein [Thermoanaerobaculia bacterium]
MSSSMLRRLALGVLVLALAFPNHAAAMPWEWGDLLGRVRGFISSIWAPNGCEIMPEGNCRTAPKQIFGEHGCEVEPDGRCGAALVHIFGENGCELTPDGRCKG